MILGELEGEGHVSPSWTGSDFDHYTMKRGCIFTWKKKEDIKFTHYSNGERSAHCESIGRGK